MTDLPQPPGLSSATSSWEQPDFVDNHEERPYVESKEMRNLKSPPIQTAHSMKDKQWQCDREVGVGRGKEISDSEDYVMRMWGGGGNGDRSLKRCLLGQPQGNGETET